MTFSHGGYCQYLPIGVLPMEYNPSFAGSVGNSRIVSNLYYYKSSFWNNTNVLTAGRFDLSYDNYYPAIRSGVGVIFNESYHSQIINDSTLFKIWSSSIDLILAPKISIKGKYTISPSFGIKYMSHYGWSDRPQNTFFDGFAIKSGILFNTSHYYIGYAIEHRFSQPLKKP
jgi:hypothetical protein